MKLDPNWIPHNIKQEYFLKEILPLCRNDDIPEIKSATSWKADEIAAFLEANGFSIKPEPFPPNTLGVASILELIIKWIKEGVKKQIVTPDGAKFDGVRLKEGVSFLSVTRNGRKQVIACLQVQTGEKVYLTMPDKPTGFDLIKTVRKLRLGAMPTYDYEGVQFPMVNIDQTNDIGWLVGLETATRDAIPIPANLTQALQQTKIKINEKGVLLKSATMIAVTLRCVAVSKPDFIIDREFLFWIERPGLKLPLVAAYVTRDDWKNPGSLE